MAKLIQSRQILPRNKYLALLEAEDLSDNKEGSILYMWHQTHSVGRSFIPRRPIVEGRVLPLVNSNDLEYDVTILYREDTSTVVTDHLIQNGILA